MNTKRATIFGLALVAALVLSVSAAQARYGGGPGGGCPAWGGGGPGYQQLTPEKQAAVEKIYAQHEKKIVELREQIFAKTTELNALAQSGKGSEKTIRELSQDIAKLRTQLYEERDAVRTALEKETGIVAGYGRGRGPGGCGGCPGAGYGRGYHQGGRR